MAPSRNDILQGTLVMLVLQTLASRGKMHGYAITTHIQRVSDELLRVEEGSLYPALHRMEQHGWRSEERRVGKECRARWSTSRQRKKTGNGGSSQRVID